MNLIKTRTTSMARLGTTLHYTRLRVSLFAEQRVAEITFH